MRVDTTILVASAFCLFSGCGGMISRVSPVGVTPEVSLPASASKHSIRFTMNFMMRFDHDISDAAKRIGRREASEFLSVGTSLLDRSISTKDWKNSIDLTGREEEESRSAFSATLRSDFSNEVDLRRSAGLARAIIECDGTRSDAYVYRWEVAAAVTAAHDSLAPDTVRVAVMCSVGLERKGLGAAQKHYRLIDQPDAKAIDRLRVEFTSTIFSAYRTALDDRGIKVTVE